MKYANSILDSKLRGKVSETLVVLFKRKMTLGLPLVVCSLLSDAL